MFKYAQIKEMLSDEISQIPPKTRLESRTVLCERYGVTRTTLDRAISDLTQQNLLYSVKGSGTFVASAPNKLIQNNAENAPTWGVIMPDVMYGLYTAILRGVSDIASAENIRVVIYNTDNDAKLQDKYVKTLVQSGVKGLVIIPAITQEFIPETYQLLRDHQIPFVFCNRNEECIPEAPLVSSNSFYGAYIGTKHLMKKGYKKIAFVSKRRYSTMLQRYYGYSAALAEAGLQQPEDCVLLKYGNADKNGDKEILRALFKGDDRVDAVFCAYEEMVPLLYEVLHGENLRVSDDVGVLSYDNSGICEMLTPKLTAISFQGYQAGHHSAVILRDLMAGQEPKKANILVLQPKLAVRQSCMGKKSDRT